MRTFNTACLATLFTGPSTQWFNFLIFYHFLAFLAFVVVACLFQVLNIIISFKAMIAPIFFLQLVIRRLFLFNHGIINFFWNWQWNPIDIGLGLWWIWVYLHGLMDFEATLKIAVAFATTITFSIAIMVIWAVYFTTSFSILTDMAHVLMLILTVRFKA